MQNFKEIKKIGKKRNKNNKSKNKNDLAKNLLFAFGISLGILYLYNLFTIGLGPPPKEIQYSEFYQMVKKNSETQQIKELAKTEGLFQGVYADEGRFFVNTPEQDEVLLGLVRENVSNFIVKPPRTFLVNFLFSFFPVLLFIGFLWFLSNRSNQMGSKIWSFGRARAKIATEIGSSKTTFDDVAGVDEAKEELQEVIAFLKDPKKFQRLGGKIPKGVLIIGRPGTGKTLLAKAVAGEAQVPFFSISGSDFVEMFVGVGASRVRDLFEQGRKAAKVSGKGCIIFIDEIDAVGRLRFSGIGGGNDEREQTLNALLVEMDGFETQLGIILVAATNRPDTLDPALLRPGRFDRRILVSLPDINGREAILKVHTKKIKLGAHVDLAAIARQTVYFSGADLANLCNEAALLAARREKESVEMQELEDAVERVMMGPEKKSRAISKHEKAITAYHEAGHALLSLLIAEVDTLSKVSIIPRGFAGGYTLTPPIEDRHYFSKKELLGKIVVALGGRVSEEINMHDITTGAENDLANATALARSMVCEYGMSARLGSLTLGKRHGPIFLGKDIVDEKDYSEATAKVIDEEVRRIIDQCYERAVKLLKEHQDQLKLLAENLIEKEILDVEKVKVLLGLAPEEKPTDTSNQATATT
ncbi:ATP-dependent zinc metalloprotease FtsH [Candidatus Omnitrophota bacterium]